MLPDNRVPTYCSTAEAAALLGVNDRTIRRAIADGRLPAYRVGSRQIRVKRADVESLITRIPAAS